MSGVNVQISTTNLTQVDRHQNDLHRLPGTHQEQNAALFEGAAHRRIAMPVEPDTIEKKNIDQEHNKRDHNKGRIKKRKDKKNRAGRMLLSDPDHLVDVQA
jgi:hypothetical protein